MLAARTILRRPDTVTSAADAVLVAWDLEAAPAINTLCYHLREQAHAPALALCLLPAWVPASEPSSAAAGRFDALVADYETWRLANDPILAGRRGDLEAALLDVYGREVAEAMIPVEESAPGGPLTEHLQRIVPGDTILDPAAGTGGGRGGAG